MNKLSVYLHQIRAWGAAARANRFFWMGLALAAVIIIGDQASKYWIVHVLDLPTLRRVEILGVFDLTYVENRGASFGMLSGMRVILSLISASVAMVLIVWLGRLVRPIAALGVAFIIGGALGNLYDRLAYGYVVDFLDFSGLAFPWVFNIADAAINVGIALLLLDAWQTREQPDET